MTADRTRTEAAALPHLGAAGVAVPEVLTPLVAEILAARQSRAEALHDKIFSVREKLRAHLAPDCPTWLREAFNELHAAHHILGGDPFDMHIRAALAQDGGRSDE